MPPVSANIEEQGSKRFRNLHTLGRGAFSHVSKTHDAQLGHVVAIKVVPLSGDPDVRRRLRRESANLAKLNHPGIVKLHECFEHNSSIYFVLECLNGLTLLRMIEERGAFTESASRSLALQMASALTFVHSKDICHRDVKADNIVAVDKCKSPEGAHWKLIDFGFSRRSLTGAKACGESAEMPITLEPSVSEGVEFGREVSIVGTLEYIAPEIRRVMEWQNGPQSYPKKQLSKHADDTPSMEEILSVCSPAIDCFALGVVVRFALTGVPPNLPGTTWARILFDLPARLRCKRYRVVRLASLSAEAKSWLGYMMAARPTERLSATRASQHRWLSNGNGDSVPTATPVPTCMPLSTANATAAHAGLAIAKPVLAAEKTPSIHQPVHRPMVTFADGSR
uniref:Protein kinase domain-containing protein n=1 Tax=Haptolina brevifila TaxID=156173 RepID=A0A7S2FGQ9_9EUKA|mmetsp:Transcript_11276/g.22809  ORF Transcript_11276/g.22809 Transcript_11276/m.22809 type:complete len:395 (+) Transcript_11276:42-1226(+)|eukprot:CAMPEP_0174713616 /NCGR_PEP_ID=MMETSP1094-20130205/14214_1 /TAXON_ID=156173 /ORGANISM="Chrysochromulina brevifilum, Strain UTEX LB 985" /LENGTH=394 /DNA_ID=CAMNT_0015912809 /DNA_START=39 /DNA_END=1223 /DNA_ORIENTATION=-